MQLKETLTHVNKQLKSSRERMQSQCNKKLNFFDYKVGAKVWVKKKNYKTGENRKLAPRKTGPWTIWRKCNNGVNYEVVNDSDKKVKIIHHNILYPYNTPPPRNDLQVINPMIIVAKQHLTNQIKIYQEGTHFELGQDLKKMVMCPGT